MKEPVVRTETHVTSWRGRLKAAELIAILTDALRDQLGTPRYGLALNLELLAVDEAGLPDIGFELVHNHDWFRRRNLDLDGSEPD